jgi:RNA polymerase primary sigma factor
MYMREMGATELLTRAGEIAIAKRIEDGLHEMVQAIAACPLAISAILASAQQVADGELRIDELVDGLNEDNIAAEEETVTWTRTRKKTTTAIATTTSARPIRLQQTKRV